MSQTNQIKPVGLNRLWEYGVLTGVLSVAIFVLWGLVMDKMKDQDNRISKLERVSEECAKANLNILTDEVRKATDVIDRNNELNQEIATYLRQMPKYKRL